MIKWIKTNGAEIETNDSKASIEMALKLGWKEKGAEESKLVKKAANKKK